MAPKPKLRLDIKNNEFKGNIHGDIGSHNVNVNVGGDFCYSGGYKADRSALADWVSDIDFSSNQSQAFERYTEGTLLWVLEAPQFVAWFDKGGMIWCNGKPGAGKTVFASFIVEYLRKIRERDPEAVAAVCYIYCRFDTTRSTLQLFESILRQLILSCPSADVERVQKAKDEGHRLTLKDLFAILQEIFNNIPNIFIVIDAFDECFDERTRHQVLQQLQQFHSVKILITSRPLPSIKSAMQGILTLVISALSRDIRTHFRVHTQINPTLARLIPKDSDVAGKIVQKADGMFLLAELHITNLATQTNTAQLIRALETLPKEATATYEQTMERIRQQDPNKRRLAFHTFSWILHACRPLNLDELRHGLAIGTLDRMAEEDDLDDTGTILSACAGLIVVNRDWLGREIVHFLHYTVQEYIQQICTASDFLSEVAIATTCLKVMSFPGINRQYLLIDYVRYAWGMLARKYEHHNAVFDLVLSQLTDTNTMTFIGSFPVRLPLSPYIPLLDTPLWSTTLPRSSPPSPLPPFIFPTSLPPPHDWSPFGSPRSLTGMHLAAIHGLVRIGEAFVKIQTQTSPALIDERDSGGSTALILAAQYGHPEVVKLLLDTALVDINTKDDLGRSAILWAAMYGRLAVVKELVAHPGVDVGSKDRTSRTPLSFAVERGHLEVVKALLTHPSIRTSFRENGETLGLAMRMNHLEIVKVLIDSPKVSIDRSDGKPLLWAAEKGHLEIVQALLVKGVNVNTCNHYGYTPLYQATFHGQLEVVRELLAHPSIDVNAGTKTPLLRAAQEGHFQIVKMLLAIPEVDVNATDRTSGHTALSCAAHSGHVEIVKALLTHPSIDVNIGTETPLLRTAQEGHFQIVKMLLAIPEVDINANDPTSGHTALSWGAKNGHLEVVKEIPAQAAVDVNLKDIRNGKPCGLTPLSCAARNGHGEVVKALLAHPNLDVNSKNKDGSTPLCIAAKNGHLDLVKLLLGVKNVQVDAPDSKGRTPFWWAAENGHPDVVKLLIMKGAVDLDVRDERGDTPLLRAARKGNPKVVMELLQTRKVDANAADRDGRTPLLLAVTCGISKVAFVIQGRLYHLRESSGRKKGYLKVVKLLCDTPDIDPEARETKFGHTPLLCAAESGHLGFVNFLLSTGKIKLPGERSASPLQFPLPLGHDIVDLCTNDYDLGLANLFAHCKDPITIENERFSKPISDPIQSHYRTSQMPLSRSSFIHKLQQRSLALMFGVDYSNLSSSW